MPNLQLVPLAGKLNIYCQSDGLLFQFILSEFLQTQKKVAEVEDTYVLLESQLISDRLRANIKNHLENLLSIIQVLAGAPTIITHEQNFSWTQNMGCLKKLRHYCYLFSQKRSDLDDAVNMNVCVSKAYYSVQQIREVILSLQHQIAENRVPNYIPLYQMLDKIIDNMRLASRQIMKILLEYKENENILYFLLKERQTFDEVYKTHFVSQMLSKMYPAGMKHAKDKIIEKYAKRGFGHLIEEISSEMLKIEALN